MTNSGKVITEKKIIRIKRKDGQNNDISKHETNIVDFSVSDSIDFHECETLIYMINSQKLYLISEN